MRLGFGYGYSPPNLGSAIDAITATIIQAANELSTDGLPVAQLFAPDGWVGTYSIVGGNGAFEIDDVPEFFVTDGGEPAIYNGERVPYGTSTVKGIRILDGSLIDFTSPISIEVAGTGLPNLTVNIPVGAFALYDSVSGLVLADTTNNLALRAY